MSTLISKPCLILSFLVTELWSLRHLGGMQSVYWRPYNIINTELGLVGSFIIETVIYLIHMSAKLDAVRGPKTLEGSYI